MTTTHALKTELLYILSEKKKKKNYFKKKKKITFRMLPKQENLTFNIFPFYI